MIHTLYIPTTTERRKHEPEANSPDSFHIRPIRQGGLIPESGEYGKSDRKFPNMEKFCGTFFVIQKYHIKATQDDNCYRLKTWCVYKVFRLPQNTHF